MRIKADVTRERILLSIARRVPLSLIPYNDLGDKFYTAIEFVKSHKRLPKRQKKTFSDYIYYTRNSEEGHDALRAYISDKQFVKDYVAAKVGSQYYLETVALLKNNTEVRTTNFPQRCCIKPTHMSGEVILRTQGEALDFEKIESWFDKNFYKVGREKNYRYLKPKVIVEPLIFDKTDNSDYKFYCYREKAKFVKVNTRDRSIAEDFFYENFFDKNWNELEFETKRRKYPSRQIQRPTNLPEMFELAETLSKNFEFIRVDLYSDGNTIIVGELTNWPTRGLSTFDDIEQERKMTEYLFKD